MGINRAEGGAPTCIVLPIWRKYAVDSEPIIPDPWQALRRFTEARIALGRAGHALPAREVMQFQLCHAQARDAIHKPVEFGPVETGLKALGYAVEYVHSQAPDRLTYLKRPDLGRVLDEASRRRLERETAKAGPSHDEVVFIIGDGLSAFAVEQHAVPLMTQTTEHLKAAGIRLCPTVFLAHQARVALSDDIGELLNARLAVILIGERPGLSAPDSLGIYLTYAPRRGRQNAERNCISNIRAAGLSYAQAALKLTYLVREALRLKLSGVALKDQSDSRYLEASR